MENYTITISRQFASLGRTIAQKLSSELGIPFYDRDIVEETAKRLGEPISTISTEEEAIQPYLLKRKYPLGTGVANIKDEIYEIQTNIIRDLSNKESCIIVGRNANYILKDKKNVLNVYIYAPYNKRYNNCIQVLEMPPQNAKHMLKAVDAARDQFRKHYAKEYKTVYDGYDLMIDSSTFGVDGAVKLIKATVSYHMNL